MMSGRHQPTNGADSAEYTDPRDTFCDLCGRTTYDGSLRAETHGGSTLWKCGDCRARDQQRYARETGDAQYAAEESAEVAWKDTVPLELTFDEWLDWAGIKR